MNPNILKYWLALFLRWRMMPIDPSKIDKATADKFNHLQGLIITKGRIKLRWDKIRANK